MKHLKHKQHESVKIKNALEQKWRQFIIKTVCVTFILLSSPSAISSINKATMNKQRTYLGR